MVLGMMYYGLCNPSFSALCSLYSILLTHNMYFLNHD